jgi:RND family efflux transporter MFP subunit
MTRPPCFALLLALLPLLAAAESYDCLMEPAEVIELGSSTTGVIDKVLVDRGDPVKAGQVVAQLNSEIEQSTVDLLRVRARSEKVIDAQRRTFDIVDKRYERARQLKERAAISAEAFDQVEAERIAAEANVFSAELNQDLAEKELQRAEVALALRSIRSPVNGILSERTLSAGEYVGNNDHVAVIVQLDPLKVEAFLPVSLYGRIKAGDVATVEPVAPLSGSYSATVKAIDRVFDAASGTFITILELPNPDGALPAGHRCRVTLTQP